MRLRTNNLFTQFAKVMGAGSLDDDYVENAEALQAEFNLMVGESNQWINPLPEIPFFFYVHFTKKKGVVMLSYNCYYLSYIK